MKGSSYSIAEGKKGFSRLIQDAAEKGESAVITRRGKPVAVIVPYDEYQQAARLEGYQQIMESRKAYREAGVQAGETYRESRRQLEEEE